MNTDENDYTEYIERYLDNEMSEHERRLFESELATNQELASDYRLHRGLYKAIKTSENERLSNQLHRINNQVKAEQSFRKHLMRRRFVQIAASFILLLAVTTTYIIWSDNPTNDDLFSSQYEFCSIPKDSRASELEDNNLMQDAFELYNQKKFPEALQIFERIAHDTSMAYTMNYYSAMAYIELGISATDASEEKQYFDKAIELLQSVIEQKDNIFLKSAVWYNALCYVKIGSKNKAIELATIMADSTSNLYVEGAGHLLEELKD